MGLEEEIRAALEHGELAEAAERAIAGYGPEVLGFLVRYLHDEEDARETFAQASADLWAGLPTFRGEASLRTWFYALARHAAAHLRRSPHRRPERRLPLSEAHALAERVRSATLPYLRTEAKSQLERIRAALEPDDRALLVLRLDRRMSWSDIARVLGGEEPPPARARREARLRKRFQHLKGEIRERCRAAGILEGSS